MLMSVNSIFTWLDSHSHRKSVKLANQLLPVTICIILFLGFVAASYFFIQHLINPFSTDRIKIEFHLFDALVGFFLYFVTAVDYALIVGRMQVTNPGSKARVIMNICTCVGCFIGVTFVLFLWGLAKEVPWLIIPILIFAGSVMIKLAFEGIEYFEQSKEIPAVIRLLTVNLLNALHFVTAIFTFWIPELASPKVKRMTAVSLAKWSLFLPFIIGLDDLVGYMGAMTIYNVFSLLLGIYFADIVIDILIFVSPSFTKKLVENSILSLLAAFAFIFLSYKSYSEALLVTHQKYHAPFLLLLVIALGIVIIGSSFSLLRQKKS
jgi:hypothetical protein